MPTIFVFGLFLAVFKGNNLLHGLPSNIKFVNFYFTTTFVHFYFDTLLSEKVII